MSELVKALRDAYEETDTVYFHLRTIINAAADTIDRLTAENAKLTERLKAAEEDLKRFSACCQCDANIDGSCCDMFDGTAENKYFCSNWQWRGPEAGKERTE